MKITNSLRSAEAVLWGHPDKLADSISDALLDAVLTQDSQGHCAVETLVTGNTVVVAGEIAAKGGTLNIEELVRNTISAAGYTRADLGFNCYTCKIINLLQKQSPELNSLQSKGLVAGDQGTVTGYATFESPDYLPLAFSVARNVLFLLSSAGLPEVYSDAKSLAFVEFPLADLPRLKKVVISVHNRLPDFPKYAKSLSKKIVRGLWDIYRNFLEIPDNLEIVFNPAGPFTVGGPTGDTGLTGRKIVVDQYGTDVPVGGGAFSGKDPSKIDRSASYYARYVAKNLVASGLCQEALIKATYTIGQTLPDILTLDTLGTNVSGLSDEDLLKKLIQNRVFDFSVENIVKELKLQNPIYLPTALAGPFGGDPEQVTKVVQTKVDFWEAKKVLLFPWEVIDRTEAIQQVVD